MKRDAPGVFSTTLVVSLLLTTLASAALVGVEWSAYGWGGWLSATCMPDNCFCEAVRPVGWVQPVNTWSSYAFVLAGLIVSVGWNKAGSRVSNRIYSMALIVIGLGSAFYHASLSFAGQFVDVMGMYLLAVLLIMLAINRYHRLSAVQWMVGYIGGNTLLAVGLIVIPDLRRWVFGGLILMVLGIEAWLWRLGNHGNTRWLVAAVGCLTAAYGVWLLDNSHLICDPTSLWQGHAIWHGLGAMAALGMYRYEEGTTQ